MVKNIVDKNEPQHPARAKLDAFSRVLPRKFWSRIEDLRHSSARVLALEHVSVENVATAFLEKIAAQRANRPNSLPTTQLMNALATYHTLATWRLTQGIYRFDPFICNLVVESVIEFEIPADVLTRLPGWCVFFDTPTLTFTFSDGSKSQIVDAWARVETLGNSVGRVLVFQPLHTCGEPDTILHAFRLPLSGRVDLWTEETARDTICVRGLDGIPSDENVIRRGFDTTKKWIMPALNLLIYLYCKNADLGADRQSPSRIAPHMVKKGLRFFPADAPKKCDVGVRLGTALRTTKRRGGTMDALTSAEKRPHIRRAHWHGVRTGPMKCADGNPTPADKRRFELRWLPPIPACLSDIDDLPATIRPC